HNIASMPAEDLQAEVVVGPNRLAQAEALRGGVEDGGQVVVVGLVVGVGGLAILLGGERVDDARVEAGCAEGALDGAVVLAGAFDGDGQVAEVVPAHGLADAGDGGLQGALAVLQGGGGDEDFAVEVGQEVTRAVLGAVKADQAETLGANGLDTRGQLPGRLLEVEDGATTPPRGGGSRHDALLSGWRTISIPEPPGSQRKGLFSFLFLFKP